MKLHPTYGIEGGRQTRFDRIHIEVVEMEIEIDNWLYYEYLNTTKKQNKAVP